MRTAADDDTEAMQRILRSARCDGELKQLVRLGRKPTPVDGEEVKPRPLKVTFTDEKAKNELLEKARVLQSTVHAHVFVVQDMTPRERGGKCW